MTRRRIGVTRRRLGVCWQVAALIERHDEEGVGSLNLVALCSLIASIG